MDAKPQRPVRSVRIRGDENIPTGLDVKKTLQRNKSVPALSVAAQAGGLKAAAKRTAFGDVSNTTRANYISKDDSSVPIKAGLELPEKAVKVNVEKKTAALLRPAHRPLSAAAAKAALKPASENVSLSDNNTTKALEPQAQPANTRKVAAKRSTAVFKDAAKEKVEPPAQLVQDTLAVANTVHRDLATRPIKEHNYSNIDTAVVEGPSSDLTIAEPVEGAEELPALHAILEETDAVRPEKTYIDTIVEEEAPYHISDEVEPIGRKCEFVDLEKHEAQHLVMEQILEERVREEVKAEMGYKVDELPISDPEEYWDDEDDVENYEEEGYTTARSYRSRGENTTGGVTTALFPKTNARIQREFEIAKQLVEGSRTLEEVEDETWDTSMVAEYGEEIFEYMRDLEIKMLPNAHYMDNQAEIQWSMRSVLIDWLVQVHQRFNLLPETLFLCVNYIDRFLSCKIVSLGKLQLVGATAIFIAAKFEEITCPSLQEIVYIVENGYEAEEILKAERFMLTMLQFELGWPGPMSFLRRISKADDYDLETRTLAKYFLEITIMDERFVGSPPSFLAAGAHCLSRCMLKKGDWSCAHIYYSGYTFAQLRQLIATILECCESPRRHHAAVFEKYADRRFKRASLFVEAEMKKGFQMPEGRKSISGASLAGLSEWTRK
ncbi:hypothetical protein L228DRAFT_235590 [Xylona heveae TC161]|uniref:Uncharacterized protein n=1 Tax=Xylona heveae (strain CBS 132557 / TC161) TaxID=1328760 RepID=A0A165JR73_XYLHT|nr:hypothetical protein L228DRAFT_235590 [Xylona heveae TC161]KZF26534.1 hypothetical protein L228DRAFT_235590 [Xylona heveae TC161]